MTGTKQLMVTAIFFGLVMGCSSVSEVPDPDSAPDQEAMEDERERAEEEAAEQKDGAAIEAQLLSYAEGGHRSEEHRARNEYRNPAETLAFLGIDSNKRVVEIWPGGGWYTEVLAPFVTGEGSYTAGNFLIDEDDPDDYRSQVATGFLERLEEIGDVLGDVHVGTFAPGEEVAIGEPESADMVVTFRNIHNMYTNENLDDALAAIEAVLAPGGVLGVVQHRAPEGSDPDETAPLGYLPEAFVIETIEAAGFELEESSEINANPDDTADHEDGVWALPPTLRGGEETAEQFKAIGESDRMTLRFVKADADDDADHGGDRPDRADSDDADDGDDAE